MQNISITRNGRQFSITSPATCHSQSHFALRQMHVSACQTIYDRHRDKVHLYKLNYIQTIVSPRSRFLTVLDLPVWSHIPPFIPKHPTSRLWKRTHPSPAKTVSSRIPPLKFYVSRIPPNLFWTLIRYFYFVLVVLAILQSIRSRSFSARGNKQLEYCVTKDL